MPRVFVYYNVRYDIIFIFSPTLLSSKNWVLVIVVEL